MGGKRNIKCHVCNEVKKNIVKCSAFRCSYIYCHDCIWALHDENFKPQKIIPSCWICYSCGKNCRCNECLGVLPSRKRRVQTTNKSTKTVEFSQNKVENAYRFKNQNNIFQQILSAQSYNQNSRERAQNTKNKNIANIQNSILFQTKNNIQNLKNQKNGLSQLHSPKADKTIIINKSTQNLNQLTQKCPSIQIKIEQNRYQTFNTPLFQIYYQPTPYIFYYY